MALRERLNEEMKAAMKAREQEKLGALRLLLAAVKQREVDERITLDDAGVVAVVEKMIKQRRDSISPTRRNSRSPSSSATCRSSSPRPRSNRSSPRPWPRPGRNPPPTWAR